MIKKSALDIVDAIKTQVFIIGINLERLVSFLKGVSIFLFERSQPNNQKWALYLFYQLNGNLTDINLLTENWVSKRIDTEIELNL